MEGDYVTIRGVVTASFVGGFTVADDEGPWNAIYVYTYKYGPSAGHKVQLTGKVVEYKGLTEISRVVDYHLLSVKHPDHVKPVVVTLAEADQESYESVLVTVENVVVSNLPWHPEYWWDEWEISNNTGSLLCSYKRDYMYFPTLNDQFDAVTGIVDYTSDRRVLQPRNTQDLESDVIPHYALKGTIVTMNKQHKIIQNGYVEVLGDRIIKVSQNKPQCDLVYNVEGWIFPGLVDAHNHPAWNVLDHISFGQTFNNRYDWQETQTYSDFSDQYHAILDYPGFWTDFQDVNVVKMGELRALCAGTTTWQGMNCNYYGWDELYAAEGIGINNAERFPARSKHIVRPLSDASLSSWPQWVGEYWERFLVHLCEGTDQSSLDEFYTAKAHGLVDERLTIIHGVALTATEFADMAAGQSNLVWSPQSNVLLYGQTANVPAALAAGVNVALAPDWTPSGEFNILDELRYAQIWSQENWNNSITPRQFADFVTVNAADALGLLDRIGSLEEGKQADLVIIPQLSQNPYSDLLETHEKDVILTVVNGRPMYGNPSLMESFPFLTDMEDISICSAPKKVAWVVWSGYSILGFMPVSMITDELVAAYNAATPVVCDFLGYDQCTPLSRRRTQAGEQPPATFALEQNYPNPFNPSTVISYAVPADGEVLVTIHDALGRHIETLVNEYQTAGRYSVTFNAAGLPSGMYHCTLLAGGVKETRWMTLAK